MAGGKKSATRCTAVCYVVSVFVATWKPISQYVAAIMFALIRWIRCLIGDPVDAGEQAHVVGKRVEPLHFIGTRRKNDDVNRWLKKSRFGSKRPVQTSEG
jgi:hypothetical protein